MLYSHTVVIAGSLGSIDSFRVNVNTSSTVFMPLAATPDDDVAPSPGPVLVKFPNVGGLPGHCESFFSFIGVYCLIGSGRKL